MTKKPYKCRVEYLESTGTQYIDTGYELDSKKKACVGFSVTSNQETKVPVGVYDGTNWTYIFYTYGANGLVTFNNSTQNNLGSFNSGRHDLVVDYKNLNYIYDGTQSTLSGTPRDYALNLFLFGRNNSGNADAFFNGLKIYYFKEYDNDVLIRDFIPVIDNSGRPAMYDQVSGQLFYNQGTGEFNYGRQIIPVEYLESTGTQYIDTGFIPTGNTGVDIRFLITGWGSGSDSNIIMSGGDSVNYRCGFGYRSSSVSSYGHTLQISGICATGVSWENVGMQAGVPHTVTYNYDNQKKCYLDGVLKRENIPYGTATITRPLYIFTSNMNGSSWRPGAFKLYYCKIIDNGVLFRDFIPCIDENLVPFLFDKVHNTVYLNAGTGQFKVGPNVEKVWGSKRLRRKLALMLANLKKKRKYYCELEFLESTGTQYIDTGVPYISATDEIELYYMMTEFGSSYSWGFGSLESGFSYGISGYNTTNGCRFTYVSTTSNFDLSTQMDTQHHLIMNNNGIYNDGTKVKDGTGIAINGSWNNYLFALSYNAQGGSSYYSKERIWRYTHKRNGVLIRDMIPVLDWDYVPCFYDKVSGQLFYNQGTGTFTYGREIHYVDYLESDGTQYIDTGVYLTNNHSVSLDYQLTSASQSRKGLFGGLNSNVSSRYGTVLSPSNQNLEAGYGSGNNYYQFGLPDTSRHVMYQKKNELYFDGVLTNTFATATFTQAQTAFLCNFNFENYNPASAKYYSSKWWDGDTLILDFKPAIDENGVGFMFDKVSHTIYDNAGTGVFGYPARETEYTGNDGTAAYIDLGVKYKPSMSIEGKYTRDTSGASGSVMLVTTTTTAPLIYLPALSGTTTERFVWRRGGYTEQSFFVNNITYPYTVEMVVDAVNDTLTLNGNVVKTGMIAGMNGYNSPYESSSNMYMFSIAGTYAGDGKVYYLKITDGTTPVFDLVPAYKDGSAGFYNKVDSTFFKNASTNTSTYLVAGKIIEPEYE